MQIPLFSTVTSDWRAPDLASLPSWEGAKRVAIDTEFRDDTLKKLGPGGGRRPDNFLVGISFAIEDGPSHYLPMRHFGGGNLPVDKVIQYFQDQARVFKGDLIGMNLGGDLDIMASDGIEWRNVRYCRDVSIADPLIYELHDRYNLEHISRRWGFAGKAEDLLNAAFRDHKLKGKGDLWKLPAKFVGPYATGDVVDLPALLRKQEREIDNQELWGVYNLESKLQPILTKMRRRGVRIDLNRLDRIERWAYQEEAAALAKVLHLTGVRIAVGDVMKAEALAPALRFIGVTLPSTSTGKVSIDKHLLGSIDHDVAKALDWARKVNKLRSTFCASVRDHMIDGRLHVTFNQLKKQAEDDEDDESGAKYGRLSSEHVNIQQQPARDVFAAAWRAIYRPDHGMWASADFSQQEPRMAVHYACIARGLIGDEAWASALVARDKYRNDPTTDNHQMMADMAGIPRKAAKNIYLGLSYNMGGAKLCQSLGLPTVWKVLPPKGIRGAAALADSPEGKSYAAQGGRRFLAAGPEGQKLLDTFDAKVPFIKKLSKACEAQAAKNGFIKTLSGRRCHFPKDADGNYDWVSKAFNRLIQGGSADQTKMAMVACDEAGLDTMIQVHDEMAFDVDSPGEAEKAATIMKEVVPLELPSKVDVEMGPSWGESMPEFKKMPQTLQELYR